MVHNAWEPLGVREVSSTTTLVGYFNGPIKRTRTI